METMRRRRRGGVGAFPPGDGEIARARLRLAALAAAGAGCIIFPEAEAELLRRWRVWMREGGGGELAPMGRMLTFAERRTVAAPPYVFIPVGLIDALTDEPELIASLDDAVRRSARLLLRSTEPGHVMMLALGGRVRVLDGRPIAMRRAPARAQHKAPRAANGGLRAALS